jgi:voltage-gated potassium channel
MALQRDFPELRKWRRATDAPLTVLALGSLPLLLLHFVSSRLTQSDKAFLLIIDVIVFAAFATDFVVEFTLSRNKRRYIRAEWLGLFIVLTQFAALLPALGAVGVFRAARGTRLVTTVLRIAGIGVATSRRQGLDMFKRQAARLAFGLAGLTWVTSAVAFTLAEDVGTGRRVGSFFDALWWSAATITTVGYGDIYPVTGVGRIIAVFTMVVGISTLAVVTARLASFLIRE